MNTATSIGILQDRAHVERVRAEEKKTTLAVAIEERIKQHRRGRELAIERIKACIELRHKVPSLRDVLDPTINVWSRIRDYHEETLRTNERMLLELSV